MKKHLSSVKKQSCIILVLFLLFSFLTGCTNAFSDTASVEDINIRILSFNDFHGALNTQSRINDRLVGGAAVLTAWMREFEKENPNTLIVSVGDDVGASQPLSSLLQEEPTIEFMNLLGVGVGAPGNHLFHYDSEKGNSDLLRLYLGGINQTTGEYFSGASFPVVCANAAISASNEPVFPPYVVKTIAGISIGFIGIVTTEENYRGITTFDPVSSIDRYVSELKNKGVKTIIVLAHESVLQNLETGMIEGTVADIAGKISDDVDIIICGHSHTIVNGIVNNKLIVQAGSGGRYFSVIDLTINKNSGNITNAEAQIITAWADEIEPDKAVLELLEPLQARFDLLFNQVITEASAEFVTYIDETEPKDSPLGNLITDAYRWVADTQIAFMNDGGIRTDVPSGKITWAMLYSVTPFGNIITRFDMTGEQICQLLEEQWILQRSLQVSGIKYSWDPNQKDNRIVSITLNNGKELDRNKSYSVATINFLANGGDGYSVLKAVAAGKQENVSGDLDALINYVKTLPTPITPSDDNRIKKIE